MSCLEHACLKIEGGGEETLRNCGGRRAQKEGPTGGRRGQIFSGLERLLRNRKRSKICWMGARAPGLVSSRQAGGRGFPLLRSVRDVQIICK